MPLEPICSYQGAKRRYADRIAQVLLGLRPTRVYDLGVGSGAVTLALLRAGWPAAKITAVDAGPWGDVWHAVGRGTLSVPRLAALVATVQALPPGEVKQWLETTLAVAPRSPEAFLLLQCASFGATPVWDCPTGWRRGGEGSGRRYCARPLWRPREGSTAKSVRGTLLSPGKILRMATTVAAAAEGLDGRRQLAELVRFARGSVVYIDPPYEGTAGYGWGLDWRSIVARHRPVVVSEGKPLPGATEHLELERRKAGTLRGGASAPRPPEWLSVFR